MENIVYKNSLSKSRTSNFYVEAPMPLDARLVVKNVDVLYDYSYFSGNLYEGMIVSVLEPVPQTYRLVRKDDINTGNKIGAAFSENPSENKDLWERIDVGYAESTLSELTETISEQGTKLTNAETNILLNSTEIGKLKERNNAEIPVYSGEVESATINNSSVMQPEGVYYIKSNKIFAAKKGSEYFANWTADDTYQAQDMYNISYEQDGEYVKKAVPNRLYYLKSTFIGIVNNGLYYFNGTNFSAVNNNSDTEEVITNIETALTNVETSLTNVNTSLKVFGDSIETITWDHTCNMNNYKTAGTYRIKGERTGNPMTNPDTDNLPIMNQGSGNTIDGILYVFDSSLTNGSGKESDCAVTQFLILSNRVGGQEGDTYMRSAYGVTKDSLIWKPWEKYQTNMEVGVVSNNATHEPKAPFNPISTNGLNSFVDNGIYSGVYLTQEVLGGDTTKTETFVMITINNYAAAGDNKTITQIKFAVNNMGVFSMEKRNTLTVESIDTTITSTPAPTGTTTDPTTTTPAPTGTLIWSDWELVNNNVDQQLDGYSKNAISNAAVYQQFYVHQEEIAKCATKDNLVQGLDWETETNKEFYIKNRTHHMKADLCKYLNGSPIEISKPSDTGYVLIAYYNTDGNTKYLKIEIKANEYKTEEFIDDTGLPIIFTWDNNASTINVQSFGGALDKIGMRFYYSSSATSFDYYFVKLDEGFLPNSLIADYNKLKDDYNELKADYTALNNRLTIIENKLNWNEVNDN